MSMKLNRLVSLLGVAGLAASASATITISASNTPFTDISATGTSVGSTSDDSELNILGSALTTAGFLGNGLLAGGVDVRVGNNGAVIWNPAGAMDIGWANANSANAVNPSITGMTTISQTDTVNGNGSSTTAGNSRQFLAVLWDDNTPGSGGSTRWQVIGGNLIIQWTNEDHFNATGTGTVTYQMVVYGGVSIASGLPLVEYIYNDTLYSANQYQNDGGSATIGYKNWGINADGNDLEFGISGGVGNTTTDPTFAAGTNMQPKVGGWAASANASLTHSVVIAGIPTPGAAALLGIGGLVALRRRRA
jgi:MYXO-CTERM domain-containing protein